MRWLRDHLQLTCQLMCGEHCSLLPCAFSGGNCHAWQQNSCKVQLSIKVSVDPKPPRGRRGETSSPVKAPVQLCPLLPAESLSLSGHLCLVPRLLGLAQFFALDPGDLDRGPPGGLLQLHPSLWGESRPLESYLTCPVAEMLRKAAPPIPQDQSQLESSGSGPSLPTASPLEWGCSQKGRGEGEDQEGGGRG